MINWELTGGAQGIRFPIGEGPNLTEFYYIMLVVAAVTTGVIFWITRSKLGLGLRAIRDNEQSAQNMGVNIFRTKLAAFMISAFVTGLVGAIHAARLGTIEPYSIFGANWTITMVNMVIIGGMGTLVGPVLGAVFVTFLGELLADFYTIHLIITGVIFILVIRFMPYGLWGWLHDRLFSWVQRVAATRNTEARRVV
jgi:branched-chain amino acid transport system permease protein